jgi:hypothetical protein
MHTSEFKQITKKKNDGTKSSAYLLIPHGVLHAVGVLLKAIPGVNLLLLKIVLWLVLLGVVDHAVNVILAQPALLIGDGDLLLLACMRSKKLLEGAKGCTQSTSDPTGSRWWWWSSASCLHEKQEVVSRCQRLNTIIFNFFPFDILQSGVWSQLWLARHPGLKAQVRVVCNKTELQGVPDVIWHRRKFAQGAAASGLHCLSEDTNRGA